MILVDTSVWVDHFRGTVRAEALAGLLADNLVLLHFWVLGELALGGLGPRHRDVLADLERITPAPRVPDREVLDLILDRPLSGLGIGWVDSHLLASALVARSDLWTFDSRLAQAAHDLGIVARPA